jgi:hypothetical protein
MGKIPSPHAALRQKGQGKEVKLAQQEDPSRFAASKIKTTKGEIGYKIPLTWKTSGDYYELSDFSEIGETWKPNSRPRAAAAWRRW